jgi:hypothetical protein
MRFHAVKLQGPTCGNAHINETARQVRQSASRLEGDVVEVMSTLCKV